MARMFRGGTPAALAPQTATGPASSGSYGGGGSFLGRLMGGRELRYNRLLDKLGSPSVLFKVPTEWGVDENNVVLGLTAVTIAAGATVTSSVNVPRDLVLRKLILVNQSLATDIAYTVTAITIEGNSVALGGGVAGATFLPGSFHSPSFDLPVAGGTPVAVSIQNNSLADQKFAPTFTID